MKIGKAVEDIASVILGISQNARKPLQNRQKQSNDKSTLRVPQHSSFMIMHIFVDWGNTGQNMAESLGITTVSTTKAYGLNGDKGKGVGRNPQQQWTTQRLNMNDKSHNRWYGSQRKLAKNYYKQRKQIA